MDLPLSKEGRLRRIKNAKKKEKRRWKGKYTGQGGEARIGAVPKRKGGPAHHTEMGGVHSQYMKGKK